MCEREIHRTSIAIAARRNEFRNHLLAGGKDERWGYDPTGNHYYHCQTVSSHDSMLGRYSKGNVSWSSIGGPCQVFKSAR